MPVTEQTIGQMRLEVRRLQEIVSAAETAERRRLTLPHVGKCYRTEGAARWGNESSTIIYLRLDSLDDAAFEYTCTRVTAKRQMTEIYFKSVQGSQIWRYDVPNLEEDTREITSQEFNDQVSLLLLQTQTRLTSEPVAEDTQDTDETEEEVA